ncbi:ABC transporter substrate-binding protein [Haloimpatiens sp. FM7330]|uniref:ABC transporter substrate-binding protein n=1 Tax=Haloimpatiens sp. FM7330 TaxID=3298610 RepID=UPI0036261D0B
MKILKKYLIVFLSLVVLLGCAGCSKKQNTNNVRNINIYSDMEDSKMLYLINFIKEEYEKENTNVKISFNNISDGQQMINILNKETADIIFTNRNNMIELARKGLIADLSTVAEENKLYERYYDIMWLYGKYNNKQYGMGIIPYSVEIMYNKKVLDSMDLDYPKDINGLYNILKVLNKNSIKVPVITTKNTNIYSLLFSCVVNNEIGINNVEEHYDSSKKYYENSTKMQKAFDYINKMYKESILSNKTFKILNEDQIDELSDESTPLIMVTTNNMVKSSQKGFELGKTLDLSNIKFKKPVVVDSIFSISNNSVDKEEIQKFVKFIYDDKFQSKLIEKKIVTGNKNVNNKLGDSYSSIINNIFYADSKNILFDYNIPKKLSKNIKFEVEEILSGKYDGKEWKESVGKTYK